MREAVSGWTGFVVLIVGVAVGWFTGAPSFLSDISTGRSVHGAGWWHMLAPVLCFTLAGLLTNAARGSRRAQIASAAALVLAGNAVGFGALDVLAPLSGLFLAPTYDSGFGAPELWYRWAVRATGEGVKIVGIPLVGLMASLTAVVVAVMPRQARVDRALVLAVIAAACCLVQTLVTVGGVESGMRSAYELAAQHGMAIATANRDRVGVGLLGVVLPLAASAIVAAITAIRLRSAARRSRNDHLVERQVENPVR